jgi:hypothetical protein
MAKPTQLLLVVLATMSLSSAAGAAGPGAGYIDLGGVNLNSYCSKTFGAGFKSVLVGKTAGDWTCQKSQNDRRPISVEKACKMQYGKSGLKAKALAWNDPLSWRCFAPPKSKK